MFQFYSRYNPPPQVKSDTVGPTLTEQRHKAECDINNILRRYNATGELIHANPLQPTWDDYTNVPEYRDMLDYINHAQAQFLELPSSLRERFSNNPVKLVEFLSQSANRDEAIRLGLVNRPPQSQNLDAEGQ